jgi:sugar phosphate isomerase/epimerase
MSSPRIAPRISVQLYSVHPALAADLDGTLAKLAAIGLERVEAFNFTGEPARLKAALDANGLASPTGHAILIAEDVQTPDGVLAVPTAEVTFEAAATLGLDYVIDPFLPAQHWQQRDDVLRSAETLNRRAEQAKAYGLKVGYHNHDHELRSVIDGQTALELFAANLDPEVALEVDVYWATASGQDAPALLRRLGDRVKALHLKDGPMREGISTAELPKDQTPAGQGDVPLAEAVEAAPSAEYGVIEFDHFAGDIFDGIAQSFAALQKLGVER